MPSISQMRLCRAMGISFASGRSREPSLAFPRGNGNRPTSPDHLVSPHVYRDEPLQGGPRLREGFRDRLDLARHLPARGAWLRRVPPAARTRARGPCAVLVAHDLAELRGFRGLDQVGSIPRGASRRRAEQAALSRPPRVRGLRGAPDGEGETLTGQAALRSTSSMLTFCGPRRNAIRTPGRTVVGSIVNSAPLALSSATAASIPLTARPRCSRPRYGLLGAGAAWPSRTAAMNTERPPRLRSTRAEPSAWVERITSAPNIFS